MLIGGNNSNNAHSQNCNTHVLWFLHLVCHHVIQILLLEFAILREWFLLQVASGAQALRH